MEDFEAVFDEAPRDVLGTMAPEEKEVLVYLSSHPDKYTLVGSRALLDSKSSDFDFVCHEDDLTPWLEAMGFVFDIRNYVNVLPLGNGMLVKFKEDIDLLVYTDIRDVEALKQAIRYMQDKGEELGEFYKTKTYRVGMFEYLYKYFQTKQLGT